MVLNPNGRNVLGRLNLAFGDMRLVLHTGSFPSALLLFHEMDHARGAKFAVELRVLALEAVVAHVELVFFAFIEGLFIIVVVGACQIF